jgi:hypothetical protein
MNRWGIFNARLLGMRVHNLFNSVIPYVVRAVVEWHDEAPPSNQFHRTRKQRRVAPLLARR